MTTRHTEMMPLADVLPADRNPKNHDQQLISASIERFGFIETPVMDDRTGKLVAGHGRTDEIRALQEAGADPPDGVEVAEDGTWMVPVLRGWSSRDDKEALAAGVALNRVGERGGWDYHELYDVLDMFQLEPGGLTGIGFDAEDLDDIVAKMQEDKLAFGEDVTFGGGGAHAEPNFDDRARRYAANGVRSMVLDYEITEFDTIAEACALLRHARGVDSNAALIAALVHEAAADLTT